MRVLFIALDAGIYGSARSLQLLIRNLTDWEIDLVVRPTCGEMARVHFSPNVRNIYECPLPWNDCWLYHLKHKSRYLGSHEFGSPKFKGMLGRLLLGVKEFFLKQDVYKIIKAGNYDVVHLNNFLLYQLIRPKYRFVVHVREEYDNSNDNEVQARLRHAAGLIYIDRFTRQALAKFSLSQPSVTLINPCDMTPLANLHDIPDFGFNTEDVTVFSMIGYISETKGSRFIIESFIKHKNPRSRLLVVGTGESFYLKMLQAQNVDSRIIYTGQLTDMNGIYRLSDYIIRGESFQGIGRTIIEGLFAGCSVIVPGFCEYDEFSDTGSLKERIHYYKPVDQTSFLEVIDRCSSQKMPRKRDYLSNVDDVVCQFKKFIQRISNS